MLKQLEGSRAVAEAVAMCRPALKKKKDEDKKKAK